MKIVGRYWNDNTIDIVEIDGEMYALYGWNGEEFYHCWKVLDSKGLDRVEDDREYVLTPVYEQIDEDEYQIVNYIVG